MISRKSVNNVYLRPNISLFKSSFAYDAIKVFNSLSLSVKIVSSIAKFKRLAFQYIFSNSVT